MLKRTLNKAVHQHFDIIIVENAASKRVRCKFCGWEYVENASWMADHVNGSAKAQACLGYSEWLLVLKDEQHVPKKLRRLDESMVIRISEERRERIDKELAQCLFQSGKPLSLFEHFFKQNFGCTLPS
jgi:hypothetical protein